MCQQALDERLLIARAFRRVGCDVMRLGIHRCFDVDGDAERSAHERGLCRHALLLVLSLDTAHLPTGDNSSVKGGPVCFSTGAVPSVSVC